jgi:phosphopantothenoylcysteine decarboxylase/phosphopantothenate--cysteine ligase
MSNIVLGISGSVAAYRAADLARDLMRAGHTVRVCLTDSASQFVTPALFEALTGQPALQDTFEEPEKGRMAHIDWARQAAVLLIAPATANTLAKLAAGIGDDMLTTLALAYTGPIVIAPAMNPAMYLHETTQLAIQALTERGAIFIDPDEGDVACGEHGQGKLASNLRIVEEVLGVVSRGRSLEGKHVLITSGPTQEPIDDVRYLTNRSSGRMGAALARAALLMGAEVTVVTGPTAIPLPLQAQVKRVHTAQEMLAACLQVAPLADIVIGAAAVADYRPANSVKGKIRRGDMVKTIDLIENPDVISEIAQVVRPGTPVIGFAAEPTSNTETARQKIERKKLSAIAMNDVSRSDIGFESGYNELTFIAPDGSTQSSGRQSKLGCALWLLERIVNQT